MPPKKPLATASQGENDEILKLIHDLNIVSKFKHLFKDLEVIATKLSPFEAVEKLMLIQSSSYSKKKKKNEDEDIKISENGKRDFKDLKEIASKEYEKKASKADKAVKEIRVNRVLKEILTTALQEILPSTSMPSVDSVKISSNGLFIKMPDSWRGDISYAGPLNKAQEPEGQGNMFFQFGSCDHYKGKFSAIQWKRRILQMPEPEGYDVFYGQFEKVSRDIRLINPNEQLDGSHQQNIKDACLTLSQLLKDNNYEYWKFLDKELSTIKPQALRGSLSNFLKSLKEPTDDTLSKHLNNFLKFAADVKDKTLSELIIKLVHKLDLDKAAKQKEIADILDQYKEYAKLTKEITEKEEKGGNKKLKTVLNIALGFYLHFKIDITNFRDDTLSLSLMFRKINEELVSGRVYSTLSTKSDVFVGTGIKSDADIVAILEDFRSKISDLYAKANPKKPKTDEDKKIVDKIIIMILETIDSQAKLLRDNSSKKSSEAEASKPVFLDDGVYLGNLVDGKPSGEGKLTYLDGSCFEGNFVDGKPSGLGKFTYSDVCNKGSFTGDQWQNLLDLKRFDDFDEKFKEAIINIQRFNFVKTLDEILLSISLSEFGDESQKSKRKSFIEDLQKKLEACPKDDKVLTAFNGLVDFAAQNKSLAITKISKDSGHDDRNASFDKLIAWFAESKIDQNIEKGAYNHKSYLFDQEMIDETYFNLISLLDFRNLRSWKILVAETSKANDPQAVKKHLDYFLKFAKDIGSETIGELIAKLDIAKDDTEQNTSMPLSSQGSVKKDPSKPIDSPEFSPSQQPKPEKSERVLPAAQLEDLQRQ